jgi:hypothetical protein
MNRKELEDVAWLADAGFCYTLLSINGVPFQKTLPVDRAQILKENEERLAWFDNYQPETTTV